MTTLSEITKKIRSKNAGPFWLTFDIFCEGEAEFETVKRVLSLERSAAVLGTDPATLKRFEIPDLKVLKISIPRPHVQGTPLDRDMHGASFGNILAELEVED